MKIKLCASPNSVFNHIQVDEMTTLCGWIIKKNWITDIPFELNENTDGNEKASICGRCQKKIKYINSSKI